MTDLTPSLCVLSTVCSPVCTSILPQSARTIETLKDLPSDAAIKACSVDSIIIFAEAGVEDWGVVFEGRELVALLVVA
jgi:hypothetical protein